MSQPFPPPRFDPRGYPHHAAQPAPKKKQRWPWVVIGVGVLAIGGGLAIGSEKPPSTPTAPTAAVPTATRARVSPITGGRIEEPAAPSAQPARQISAREWALIAKSPDAHTGERIVVYGQVMQFDATTGGNGFRANVDGVEHKPQYGYADYDTNTILHSDAAALLGAIVQDDLFKAEVTVAGAKSYETVMGGTLTAPQLTVTQIDVIGHVA